jgi:hypothetical protein
MLSPYRCRDCTTQFWVISRKTYVVGASLLAAILVMALLVLLLDFIVSPNPSAGSERRRSDGGQPVRLLIAVEAGRMPRGGA